LRRRRDDPRHHAIAEGELMHPRRLPVVLSLVASLALVAACGSAAGTASPGAATQGTTGTQAPAATQATGTQGPAATIDLGNATGGLANLSSYKVTMVLTGSSALNVETVVVNGATPGRSVMETSGSTVLRVIEIGPDVWVDQGSGTYVKNAIPKTTVDAMMAAFDPVLLFANIQKNPDVGYLQNQGTETHNGINSVHLHADSTTPLPAGATPIPAGTVFDMWVAADGGYLVGLEGKGLAATGSETDSVSIELSNVNDPSLTVTPPA
jgi:hypothetical protein